MGKWLAGILAAIIVGLIMFGLTHEGGPLNPTKIGRVPSPAPAHVTITDFEFHVTWTPQIGNRVGSYNTSGNFTVYNDGEVSAEGCQIYIGHDKALTSYDTLTTSFAVPPKQSSSVATHLEVWLKSNTQMLHLVAQAWCKNGVKSDTVERDVLLQEGVNQ
jgi:hypothetical protein